MVFSYLNIRVLIVLFSAFTSQDNCQKGSSENSKCADVFSDGLYEKLETRIIIRADKYPTIPLGELKLSYPDFEIDSCHCNDNTGNFKLLIRFQNPVRVNLYYAKKIKHLSKKEKFRIIDVKHILVNRDNILDSIYNLHELYYDVTGIDKIQYCWIKILENSSSYQFLSMKFDDKELIWLVSSDFCNFNKDDKQ